MTTLTDGALAASVLERAVRIGAPLTEEQRARLAEIAEKTPVTKIVKVGAGVETEVR